MSACAALGLAALLLAPGSARADDPTPSPEPIRLPPMTEITTGSQHSCAIVEGGAVWCWGFPELGLGAGPDAATNDVPVLVELPRPAIAVDAGFEGTCAITDDGAVWCWGANDSGQVGDGTQVDRYVPTRVVGLDRPAIRISRGYDHACALLDDGTGWCWGDDTSGALGDGWATGDPLFSARPVQIAGVPRLAAVSAGANHTCGLGTDGSAWCWGNPVGGVLGRGEDADSRTPGQVAGLDGGVDVLEAGDETSCAIRDGELLCWGLVNVTGTGEDRTAVVEWTPQPVEIGARVVAVDSANGYHVCVRDDAGATWCWGDAEARQLGPTVGEDVGWVGAPVRQDLPGATALATGYDFTCALFAPDDLRCWGDGDPIARNPWTGEAGPPAGGFREPGPLVPTITTYIPTPRDVSTAPPVVGANLLLAAAVMILFTLAGELLNRTLAENEDAFATRGGVAARLRRARVRLDEAMAGRLGHGRLLTLVRLAGIAAVYGLVFSILDPTWDPLSVTGLWLFVSMAVAFGVVGIADDLACWSLARRWGVAADLDLRPGNLLAAVVSTGASRIITLVPGVMIGMPEALEVDADALDAHRRARLAAVGLGTLVVVGAVSWAITLATSVVGSSGQEGIAVLVGGIEAFFLVVFAVTVQNSFAQLLAFRGTPGGILRSSHRWAWLGGLLLVTFLFWHTLVNPRGDLATALQETNVVAFVATAVGFVVAAFAVWAYFRLRARQARVAPAVSVALAAAPPAAPGAKGGDDVSLAADSAADRISVADDVSVAAVPAGPAAGMRPASPPAAAPSLSPVATAGAPAAMAAPQATAPAGAPALSPGSVVAFDLRAVGDARLFGPALLRLRSDGVGLLASWVRLRDARAQRIASTGLAVVLLAGLVGIALLTFVPGFRFHQVPWLLPTAVLAAVALALGVTFLKRLHTRRRWSGEVVVPSALVVGVRTAFDRTPLVLACILLTPIGGAIYAALVGRTVVRLRGPFDPEREVAREVRLRCRDRDEATDIAARVRAIRAGGPTEVSWR